MPKHMELVRSNFSKRQEIAGELATIDEAATTDNRSYTEAEDARITELRSELDTIDKRITANLEMEERSSEIEGGIEGMLGAMLDRDSGEVLDTRSIGQRFAQADGLTEFGAAGARGQFAVQMDGLDIRAVTDVTTGSTSGGAFVNNQRLGRVGADFPDRKVYVTDLIPHIPVSTGSVEYVQDQSPLADMANKAVEVTEGSAKPQAGPTLAVITEAMATIAAWVNITRQTAADVPQIQGYLDNRLRYSLKRRLDAQVIAGNGTSPNISGFTDRSGINTYAPGSAEDRYISIRHAIRLMEDDEVVPEIIVLNPADAEIFDLTNGEDDGLHAVPNVAGPSARTAWGLTQVRSTAITAGTAVLVDPMCVALLDRMAPTAYMTDSHASNFTANILTLLLELRAGLAVFEPVGICSVTFNGTA